MNWLQKFFKAQQKSSASVAKDRLQVILSASRQNPDYLAKLQQEIMEVIAKYVQVNQDEVVVEFAQKGERQILELNVMLPEKITGVVRKPEPGSVVNKAANQSVEELVV